jgi:Glycosyltransferase family 87
MEEKVPGHTLRLMLNHLLHEGQDHIREPIAVKIRKNPFQYLIIFLCIVNITLIAINIGLWIEAARQKLFVAADFTAFYTGYSMVRHGDAENLYDLDAQTRYQQALIPGLVFDSGVLPYLNPPFVALFLSPLSLLPLETAFYLWSFLQLGVLVWFFMSINRQLSHWEKHERIIVTITILAFWPLTYTFLLGQFSLILLVGLLQTFISLKESRLTIAGSWFSILFIKPQILLIPGMMMINKKFWRVAASLVGTGIFFLGVSSIFMGVEPWFQYIRSMLSLGSYFGQYGLHPKIEYTFRGVLSTILGYSQGKLTNTVSIIALITGMVMVWFLWRNFDHHNSSRLVLLYSFTLLLTIFLSLHLNPHDSLLLVLPVLLFYDYLRQNDFPRKAFIVLMLLCPVVFLFATFNGFNFLGVIRPPVVIILMMLAWMAKYLVYEYQLQKKDVELPVSPAQPG